ncbi:hypothetical protein LSCM1_00784 [Leishmania martiniquensis]|uniref:Arf-GAP domain-containing protein n=1 Tax=Leishmania martiniquensis TaxID=1580590 RepID=A0A836G5B6_9TRYP|nr:hypothetical protein LSCM1_00784 [Leishmania martiniquensis]
MDEVSLETLLLGGECHVQWGSRGTLTVRRTVELHSNNILYCFEEPKNSMAKHIREKVYVEGCHVVDGGAYNGASERLLLFLANYDYAEKVDLLGNHQTYILAAKMTTHDAPLGQATRSAPLSLPGADYVVQLFFTEKMLKWRLLQAIQRASKEYLQLFPGADTVLATPMTRTMDSCDAQEGSSRVAGSMASGVPNQFESKVLGRPSRDPLHSRTESGTSVLSDHEVLQLSDVLREYEELQKGKGKLDAIGAPLGQPKEGEREAPPDDGGFGTARCVMGSEMGAAAPLPNLQLGAPERLRHSPLYKSCIESKPANQICAECGEPFPSWCILQPFGAFVCIQCIGVHRKLWPNKCRGAELDRWPESDVAFMEERGNDVVNSELEYFVAFPNDSVEFALHTGPVWKPVLSFSSAEARESFIRWKYEELLFTRMRHPDATGPLPPQPDPVGLERCRLANLTPAPEAVIPASDASLGAAAPQQQQSLLCDQGPPRYAGLLDIVVKELVGPESLASVVCVLTNGFQSLRTRESRRLLHMRYSTAWDEHLQLGIEGRGQKPLYCTLYRGRGELLAAAEVWMKEEVFQPGASCMFASELAWSQLHKKPSQRTPGESWNITFLASYQLLT